MSLLSAIEILELIDQGVIENTDKSLVNAASLDVRLGDTFLIERFYEFKKPVEIDLSQRERPIMDEFVNSVVLRPNNFCLTSTKEIFHLPDTISIMFTLNSSLGRAGLEHSQSVFGESGWNGSALTLELRNVLEYSYLKIKANMSIGKVIFFRHTKVPEEYLYSNKGSYNDDRTVQPIKQKESNLHLVS